MRRLTLLYTLALGTVAVLAFAGQMYTLRNLRLQAGDTNVISVAEHQRMYSQKIVKAALALTLLSDPKMRRHRLDELDIVTTEWAQHQKELQQESPSSGLPNTNSPSVQQIYVSIEPSHRAMVRSSRIVQSAYKHGKLSPSSAPSVTKALRTLLSQEDPYLAGMDRIVAEYQHEAERQAATFRHQEGILFVIILVVLVLIGCFIFRPVLRRTEKILTSHSQRLEKIIRTQDEVGMADLDIDGMLRLIVEEVPHLTGASGAFVETIDGDEIVCRAAAGSALAYVGKRLKPESGLSGESVPQQEITVCEDALADTRVDAGFGQELGLRSMITVPLIYKNTVFGALKVYSSQPSFFKSEDIGMLKLLGGFASSTLGYHQELENNQHLMVKRTADLGALRYSEERFRGAMNAMEEGLIIQDVDGKITVCNPSAERILGLNAEQLIGVAEADSQWTAVHEDGSEFSLEHRPARIAMQTGKTQRDVRVGIKRPDGTFVWTSMNAAPFLRTNSPSPCGAIVTLTDISYRKELEQQVAERLQQNNALLENSIQEHARTKEQLVTAVSDLEEANRRLAVLATTDGLTQLKNHRAFQDILTYEFARVKRYQSLLSIVMIDVDHFKDYNDTFGHPAGDEVLRAIGEMLKGAARQTDCVARYGGEEFVLILPETGTEKAMIVAERCRTMMEQAVWANRDITISVGVASYKPATTSVAHLISEADAALYHAKQGGRNRSAHFQDIDSAAEGMALLESGRRQ